MEKKSKRLALLMKTTVIVYFESLVYAGTSLIKIESSKITKWFQLKKLNIF